MPQLWELLRQNREYPPINFLATQMLKGTSKKRAEQGLNEQLKNIPNVQTGEFTPAVRSRTGSKIVSVVHKKSGRKVI